MITSFGCAYRMSSCSRRILLRRRDIAVFKIRIIFKNFSARSPRSQESEHVLHAHAKTADRRASTTQAGLHDDAMQFVQGMISGAHALETGTDRRDFQGRSARPGPSGDQVFVAVNFARDFAGRWSIVTSDGRRGQLSQTV